ncbi:MAG: short-chain dehydrogenase [Chloroflexi bacterium HGW-Chloroflexi-5]|jgi:short-subunit dehydrogenase|nr:MAG: short-chain dehydrogenase [Chloroflexi bacterium HGW-Chloroflexi-5]PKP09826.1 MAG: short-chain dehydrogenase [Bacteroidetes bacterium HGW-Bacteroidetes-4]
MNILITGTSRGIGFEMVKYLTKEPGHKIIMVSRNSEKLNELANYCKTEQPYAQIIPLVFDLSKTQSFQELNALITDETDSIDVLINNAGYLINKPFSELSSSEVAQIYRVNILGPIELIKTCLPLLEKSEKAHVVNISSMGGFQGSVKFPGLATYASSKAALASLTECLAEEYKESRIKFNCLALGAVATEMLAEAFPGYEAPTTAQEMGKFIADFALSGHHFFNGKILPVSQSTP